MMKIANRKTVVKTMMELRLVKTERIKSTNPMASDVQSINIKNPNYKIQITNLIGICFFETWNLMIN